jgi:hypothetical protein
MAVIGSVLPMQPLQLFSNLHSHRNIKVSFRGSALPLRYQKILNEQAWKKQAFTGECLQMFRNLGPQQKRLDDGPEQIPTVMV